MTGASTAADTAESTGELTVDELAARTGMTVRTVRFYASEGLLPPPERRGRIAYYDARHRMRLELIRTLQEHGYTLAAVERVLARIPQDAAPAEYAVQSAVLAPWLPDRSEMLDRATLERRVGRQLDDDQVDFLASVGALEAVGAAYRTSPALLGHAVELLQMPVPPTLLAESIELIDRHARAVADGLSEIFARGIWGPYQRGELEHEQVVALLEAMRPLALQGLVSAFTRAADDTARRRVEKP
ncbi:MAG: MerR family transcriptional regulator [Jatrophihabitans sp.]